MGEKSKSVQLSDTYPDIVIHGGQVNYCNNNQLLVCEIKRNKNGGKPSKTDIITDLKKLGWYVKHLFYNSQNCAFGAGCFIMTNTSSEDLRLVLKEIKENNETICFPGLKISEAEQSQTTDITEVAHKITIFSYQKLENEKPKVEKFCLKENFNCKETLTDKQE